MRYIHTLHEIVPINRKDAVWVLYSPYQLPSSTIRFYNTMSITTTNPLHLISSVFSKNTSFNVRKLRSYWWLWTWWWWCLLEQCHQHHRHIFLLVCNTQYHVLKSSQVNHQHHHRIISFTNTTATTRLLFQDNNILSVLVHLYQKVSCIIISSTFVSFPGLCLCVRVYEFRRVTAAAQQKLSWGIESLKRIDK